MFKEAVFWIAGDFNFPDIAWQHNTIHGHKYRRKINELYLNMEHDTGLSQIIDFPTRG
ncbi:hypothetical protein DPMN_056646 [Dreissena polymorpha]|uniref:Endonuclease/exonuclease/phosphatase domain-containing protein n=1 Tax=Dreissena polymorpha TaxID=45954 RepID=A0A9D4CUX7_DREPO|nr:hypothetical protein DPMN_056646 [Dreissena polymorpha]